MKRKYERDTHVVWQELIHISMKYTVNFISPFYKNLANVPYIKHSVKYWRFSKGIIVFARMRFFFLILIHLLFIITLIVSDIEFEIHFSSLSFFPLHHIYKNLLNTNLYVFYWCFSEPIL